MGYTISTDNSLALLAIFIMTTDYGLPSDNGNRQFQ
jgi:hypothetical protein